jgi:hypothetical protein
MKALAILGKNRIYLLKAMKPFVPKEDIEQFKRFIKTNNAESSPLNALWSSESSSETNSEAESQLSQ